MILLAPTPEVWDEVGKSFSVNDTYGLVELSGKGVFGVSNGTKILVIDKKGTLAPLYKVRILQGVRSIDEDKVGRAGWLPRDFVSAN